MHRPGVSRTFADFRTGPGGKFCCGIDGLRDFFNQSPEFFFQIRCDLSELKKNIRDYDRGWKYFTQVPVDPEKVFRQGLCLDFDCSARVRLKISRTVLPADARLCLAWNLFLARWCRFRIPARGSPSSFPGWAGFPRAGGLCIRRGCGRFFAGWNGTEEWRKYPAGFPAQVLISLERIFLQQKFD